MDNRLQIKLRDGEDIPFPKDEFKEYLDRKYKELVEAYAKELIPFKADKIGKLWITGPNKQKFELDIVAVGKDGAGRDNLAAFDVSWTELNDNLIEYKMNALKEKLELHDDKREKQIIIVGKNMDAETRKKYTFKKVYDLKKIEKLVATHAYRKKDT